MSDNRPLDLRHVNLCNRKAPSAATSATRCPASRFGSLPLRRRGACELLVLPALREAAASLPARTNTFTELALNTAARYMPSCVLI